MDVAWTLHTLGRRGPGSSPLAMKRRMVFSNTTSTCAASERLTHLGSRSDPTYGAHTDIGSGMIHCGVAWASATSVETPASPRLDLPLRGLPDLVRASVHYDNADDQLSKGC